MGWVITVFAFIFYGFWWMSGWQGGNRDEPNPITLTFVVALGTRLLLWWLGFA